MTIPDDVCIRTSTLELFAPFLRSCQIISCSVAQHEALYKMHLPSLQVRWSWANMWPNWDGYMVLTTSQRFCLRKLRFSLAVPSIGAIHALAIGLVTEDAPDEILNAFYGGHTACRFLHLELTRRATMLYHNVEPLFSSYSCFMSMANAMYIEVQLTDAELHVTFLSAPRQDSLSTWRIPLLLRDPWPSHHFLAVHLQMDSSYFSMENTLASFVSACELRSQWRFAENG